MMYSFKEKSKPTKSYLLQRINQERVFEDFGIPYKDYPFRNPIRKEKNNSCRFYYNNNGELVLEDFTGWFKGNCFDFVCFVNNVSFVDCLNLINEKYVNEGEIKVNNIGFNRKKVELKEHNYSNTEIIATFDKWNTLFWKNLGVSKQTLKRYKVRKVKTAWVNKKIIYNEFDYDCFCYYLGEVEGIHRVKLYSPGRPSYKFITNSREIEGYEQLDKEGDTLVITKSMKDVMVFREFGFNAIAPPSEAYHFKDEFINELKSRFTRIVVIFDFDLTGVRGMNALKKKGIEYRLLQSRREQVKIAKDLSDFCKIIDNEELINLKLKNLSLDSLIIELRRRCLE